MADENASWTARHPVVVYTVARLGLFVGAYLLLGVSGARGLLLLALAFLVSGLLSLVLLNGPRSGFSAAVAGYFGRINGRIDAAARAEDEPQDPPPGGSADDGAAAAVASGPLAGPASADRREPSAEGQPHTQAEPRQ